MADGCRALVFGGSGALGRVVCRMLAEQGARVAFTYHTSQAIADELTARSERLRAFAADLTSVAAVERTVDSAAEALGGIDALIHCAGLCSTPGDPVPEGSNQRMDDVGEAGFDQVMAVNVKSAYFACRHAARHMRRSGGNVVLIGSIANVKPLPTPVHYAASKGALVGMTLSMAKEFGPLSVCVNLVSPGLLEAGIARTEPQALVNDYLRHCGLRRVGRMEEIAAVIVWLARHNTYVTGQSIVVDGAL